MNMMEWKINLSLNKSSEYKCCFNVEHYGSKVECHELGKSCDDIIEGELKKYPKIFSDYQIMLCWFNKEEQHKKLYSKEKRIKLSKRQEVSKTTKNRKWKKSWQSGFYIWFMDAMNGNKMILEQWKINGCMVYDGLMYANTILQTVKKYGRKTTPRYDWPYFVKIVAVYQQQFSCVNWGIIWEQVQRQLAEW